MPHHTPQEQHELPPHQPSRPRPMNIHNHAWLVGVLGLIAGLLLLVYVPSLEAVSKSIVLFAAFHLVGGAIVFVSLYSLALRRIFRSAFKRSENRAQDGGEKY